MHRYRRALVLILVVSGALALAIWAGRHFGWDTLARNQAALAGWVAVHPLLAGVSFVLAYVLTAALSLPNAAVLTVAGGLLFGTAVGCALTVTGATIGATLLLLAARTALGDWLTDRGGPLLQRVRDRLQHDGFRYLLALRLVPLVPFWVVNLAAAIGGMRIAAFVSATALGIIPASFILSSIGSGIGGVLAEGHTPDLSVLFKARVILPLLGLAALSLLPVAFRAVQARRRARLHA